ncbi:hypothetical protein MN608_03272 [Microdochium nivale]|nr:hypothetical protein MN608_03272 [Microdochium nivale]
MSLGGRAAMHSSYMDSPAAGRAPLSGVHPGMYRPPASPSISDSTYRERPSIASGANSYFISPAVKRKRNAAASIDLQGHWGLGIDTGAVRPATTMTPTQEGRRKISRGNSRYTLAGEIATPGVEVQSRIAASMEDSVYSDTDYRRDGGSRRSQDNDDDEDELGAPLSRYTTAESQPEAAAARPDSWGAFAFSTIGGVVGKVWNFCKGGAFRGFQAGGGQGYQISTPTSAAPKGEVWCNEHDVPTLLRYSVGSTPGAFPETSHAREPPIEADTPDSMRRPTAKRRQISGTIPGEELRRNWVMVSEDANNRRSLSAQPDEPLLAVHQQPSYRPSIGTRRISRPVSRIQTPSHPRRQSGRASLGGNIKMSASTASLASTRSPVPDDPPSRIPVRSQSPMLSPSRASSSSQQSLTHFARIPSPSPFSHRRSQSAASSVGAASGTTPGASGRFVKKRESMSEVSENSPRLDKQARKLAAKRTQEERQADMRINDFNSRLQEMIRQGKEALGTTIEVDLDDDAGGADVGAWEDD